MIERIRETYRRIRERGDDGVWISLFDEEQVIERAGTTNGPLSGRLVAVKDNIDVAGLPTTAGCPEFAYKPERNAFVVQKLIDAGALVIGKTNLDQFATGLNGTRTPYTIPRNEIDKRFISGGSSSGSAVAVAAGLVDFSSAQTPPAPAESLPRSTASWASSRQRDAGPRAGSCPRAGRSIASRFSRRRSMKRLWWMR